MISINFDQMNIHEVVDVLALSAIYIQMNIHIKNVIYKTY